MRARDLTRQQDGDALKERTQSVRRVLVVEGNQDVADVFKSYLELYEFQVVVESAPEVAFVRAKEGLFDAYIIDIAINNMEGIELVRLLRNVPFAKASVILTTTAYGDDYRTFALEAGADAFFVKPVDADRIVECLVGKKSKVIGG